MPKKGSSSQKSQESKSQSKESDSPADERQPKPKNGESEGKYVFKKGEILNERYQLEEVIEETSQYSLLLAADNKSPTVKNVVVKIMNASCKEMGENEVKTLSELNPLDANDHSHVIRLLDSFTLKEHYCLVLEHTSKLTAMKQDISSLPDLKFVAVQLLSALVLLENHDITHCDLKLDNVMIRADSKNDKRKAYIKLAGFGNAKKPHQYPDSFDIQSLCVRAPDVVFGLEIAPPLDMWSLGCILMELHLGFPLFTVENEAQLVHRMYELLGPPPKKLYSKSKFYSKYFTKDNHITEIVANSGNLSSPHYSVTTSSAETSLQVMLQSSTEEFKSFISGLLTYDPAQRMTAEQALTHPFLFPASYDLFNAFLEYNLEIEDEKQKLMDTFAEEKKAMLNNFQMEKDSLLESFEKEKAQLLNKANQQLNELKQRHEQEKKHLRGEWEVDKKNIKTAAREELNEKEKKWNMELERLRAKYEEEKFSMRQFYTEKATMDNNQLKHAKAQIEALEQTIASLKDSIASIPEREEPAAKKPQKQKRAISHTDFDLMAKARHEKKHKREESESPIEQEKHKNAKDKPEKPEKRTKKAPASKQIETISLLDSQENIPQPKQLKQQLITKTVKKQNVGSKQQQQEEQPQKQKPQHQQKKQQQQNKEKEQEAPPKLKRNVFGGSCELARKILITLSESEES